jgi:hypothetical protein
MKDSGVPWLGEVPAHWGVRRTLGTWPALSNRLHSHVLSLTGGKAVKDEIKLLDIVALTTDVPQHNLYRGEIGAVVECYTDDTYEVEFVAQDGYTYALVPLRAEQLIPLREKPAHDAPDVVPVMA